MSIKPAWNLSNPITQNDLAGSKKLYNFFDNVFAIGQSAQDKRIKFVKQVKVRASEYMYDSDNVIVYEITSEDGYVRFLHKGYGKESEHLRDKSEEDESQVRSYILTCHREGKSVREIADLVNRSKTSVHRIIAREKNKEEISVEEAVPLGDVGQMGHLGQLGQSKPVQVHGRPGIRDDLVFEMDENHCF
ncbi:MAG: helix-turn-helix domain-containing protein [Petrimonas sp.]|nr:helix-turn-helix domain-containing protein [Petrimonas sp.]